MLDDPRVDDLVDLINDSFRVHPNREPVYVELSNHLRRTAAPQHQVVFGRRGSGKSCLLVHFHRTASSHDVRSMYVNADIVKRLSYPDLLIRLLVDILRNFPDKRRSRLFFRKPTFALLEADALEALLDEAESQSVSRSVAQKTEQRVKGGGKVRAVSLEASDALESSNAVTSEYVLSKLEHLERHLTDFRAAIEDGLTRVKAKHAAVIVDDFYLIAPAVQPDVMDYLHRLVRGTDAYLKIGTVRHRTRLVRYDGGQTIGVERRQDMEFLDLDQTFADVEATKNYLSLMLDSMGAKVEIEEASKRLLSSDGLLALTLASGGVPRDYLNIFAEAVQAARAAGATGRITPKHVYRAAARESYRGKLSNLRQDAGGDAAPLERLFADLLQFCLREKKKTAFLISQEEAKEDPRGHDLVQQLMDFKFIHVVEPDTSAASGRSGRYEAYTLDFASFMEPRRRGIEMVEFWKDDEQRRRKGLREAPIYGLARGRAAAEAVEDVDALAVAESLDLELGFESEAELPYGDSDA